MREKKGQKFFFCDFLLFFFFSTAKVSCHEEEELGDVLTTVYIYIYICVLPGSEMCAAVSPLLLSVLSLSLFLSVFIIIILCLAKRS